MIKNDLKKKTSIQERERERDKRHTQRERKERERDVVGLIYENIIIDCNNDNEPAGSSQHQ